MYSIYSQLGIVECDLNQYIIRATYIKREIFKKKKKKRTSGECEMRHNSEK